MMNGASENAYETDYDNDWVINVVSSIGFG